MKKFLFAIGLVLPFILAFSCFLSPQIIVEKYGKSTIDQWGNSRFPDGWQKILTKKFPFRITGRNGSYKSNEICFDLVEDMYPAMHLPSGSIWILVDDTCKGIGYLNKFAPWWASAKVEFRGF